MPHEPDLAITGLVERDVDLLLVEELVVNPTLLERFLDRVGIRAGQGLQLKKAERSVTSSMGESDVVLHFASSAGRGLLLIENKIAASFQPKQAERYRERAGRELARGAAWCRSVLVAPKVYASGNLSGFDARIDYEDLVAWLDESQDAHSRFKIRLLAMALERSRSGYHPINDQTTTDFWHAYWRLATDHAPRLGMQEPSGKPSGSSFIYFQSQDLPDGTVIVHKTAQGAVDLQIAGRGGRVGELQARLKTHLLPGMTIRRVGKSAAIRLKVPVLSLADPLDDQTPLARASLDAAVQLLDWAKSLPENLI